MRIALSCLALSLGLLGVPTVCAAKSYVVLLKNPLDINNHIQITNSKGTFGTNSPGFGTEVNKYRLDRSDVGTRHHRFLHAFQRLRLSQAGDRAPGGHARQR